MSGSERDYEESVKLARAIELDACMILKSEIGSTSHGVSRSGLSDTDEIAIYIPSIAEVVGIWPDGDPRRQAHFVYRPGRRHNEPSKPGDLDRTYHSLRKYIGMLQTGNASALYALFAIERYCDDFGCLLRELRGSFVNAQTRSAYLGYMQDQRERMTGKRGAAGRIRRSPEGGGEIDWKYAMHMVRLGVQANEYLTTGFISTPSLYREMLTNIRYGEVPFADVMAIAESLEDDLKALDLPAPEMDDHQATVWLADMHDAYWSAHPC